MVLLSLRRLCRRVAMRWVKSVRDVKVHVTVSEETIRSLLCRKLQGARGNVMTIKTGQLCAETLGSAEVSMKCKVAVRRYVLSYLQDAIIDELSEKYRIVVLVNKAREILRCHEN
jgi:hypothetical protein